MANSTRRSFVDLLLSTSLGATTLSILYPVIQFLIPPEVSESQENTGIAATASELTPNSAKIFKFGIQPALLVRTPDGEFRAFTAICTHLNCTVQYREDLEQIWCACHNGYFDLNGINVAGPPPRPLEQYEVNLSGNDVVVTRM